MTEPASSSLVEQGARPERRRYGSPPRSLRHSPLSFSLFSLSLSLFEHSFAFPLTKFLSLSRSDWVRKKEKSKRENENSWRDMCIYRWGVFISRFLRFCLLLSLSLSLSLFFSDMGCEMAVPGRDEMYEVDLISCGLRPLLTVLDIVFESATYLGSCLACFFSFFSTCAVRRA